MGASTSKVAAVAPSQPLETDSHPEVPEAVLSAHPEEYTGVANRQQGFTSKRPSERYILPEAVPQEARTSHRSLKRSTSQRETTRPRKSLKPYRGPLAFLFEKRQPRAAAEVDDDSNSDADRASKTAGALAWRVMALYFVSKLNNKVHERHLDQLKSELKEKRAHQRSASAHLDPETVPKGATRTHVRCSHLARSRGRLMPLRYERALPRCERALQRVAPACNRGVVVCTCSC